MSMFTKLTPWYPKSGANQAPFFYANRYLIREIWPHMQSSGTVLVYGPTEDDATVVMESPEAVAVALGYDDPAIPRQS